MVFAVSFSVAGCSFVQSGKSAYELAVQQGFEGTLDEWLESLKGADGDDGAKGDSGSSGLRGEKGDTGVDINHLYEFALENGLIDEDMTLLEFIKEVCSETSVSDTKVLAFHKIARSSVAVVCQFGSSKVSMGSGVVYLDDKENGDAYIITNYHVVYGSASSGSPKDIASSIKIYWLNHMYTIDDETNTIYDNGYGVAATYLGGSKDFDIAVLKISGSEDYMGSILQPATLDELNDVRFGERTLVFGNAEGEGLSAVSGSVSVEVDYISMSKLSDESETVKSRVIRTDAPLNHGNSGGGLFDANGRLIGIVSARNEATGVVGFGYAIPLSIAKGIADKVIGTYAGVPIEGVNVGILGITVSSLTESEIDDESSLILSVDEMVVSEVTAGSSADGFVNVGDSLISYFDSLGVEHRIKKLFEIGDFLLTLEVGDSIKLKLGREGSEVEVEFEILNSYFVE